MFLLSFVILRIKKKNKNQRLLESGQSRWIGQVLGQVRGKKLSYIFWEEKKILDCGKIKSQEKITYDQFAES